MYGLNAMNTLTQMLDSWRDGNDASLNDLFDLAYDQLKQIAAQRLRSTDASATLSPTELVNEAVVRVMGATPQWQNRSHFFASMSLYMRAVLVDHARARQSERRGNGVLHVTLGHARELGDDSAIADLLALDSALNQLEAQDARSSAVLHLVYFAGFDRHQIAEVLGIAVQIVDRELRFAKSWLNAHLGTAI
jgi:RNA polymerase sigma factor (TIGR02999 family)